MKSSLSYEDRAEAMTSITAMYKQGWSLLCSGFTMNEALDMKTMSGRKTNQHLLCTASTQARENDYEPMLTYLKEVYPDRAFTPARRGLYEIVKNVPGYCGLWIEMKAQYENGARSTDIMSVEDLGFSFLMNKLDANPHLFTDYWRAVANRQDDVKESEVVPRDVRATLESLGALLPTAQSVGERGAQVSKDDVHDGETQMEGSQQQGVKAIGRYYLSPLVFTNPWLSGAREYCLIATAVKLLQKEGPWTALEKGKALNAILVVQLALTAAHVNDTEAGLINPAREVAVRTLVTRLCGTPHAHVSTHMDAHKVDESLPAIFPDYSDAASFSLTGVCKSVVQKEYDPDYDAVTNRTTGKAIVKDLSAFPAVWSEVEGVDVKGPSATAATAEKQAKRLAENVAALNSPHFSVLRPQCPTNSGCGAALMFHAGKRDADNEDIRAKVLLLFETNHHACGSGAQDTPERISTKAFHALHGVCQYVSTCNIRRVCFVYCNTAVKGCANAVIKHSSAGQNGPFMMEHDCEMPVDVLTKPRGVPGNCTLSEMMRTLGGLGCTSSLHTVWTEDGWRDLLDSLYLIVPDID